MPLNSRNEVQNVLTDVMTDVLTDVLSNIWQAVPGGDPALRQALPHLCARAARPTDPRQVI
jgi:hypothetical protein